MKPVLRGVFVVVSMLLAGRLVAQCVPAPNHHCIEISSFSYVPNVLTVVEGDTVEFSASSFHPLRQVIRAFPSTTATQNGLTCDGQEASCIQPMDASVHDADGQPVFHFICVNHIQQVMRGDIFILPQTIFASGFEDM